MLCTIPRLIQVCPRALLRAIPRLRSSLRALTALGVLTFWLPSGVLAAQITLTWDPVQTPDLAGYKIYYGSGTSGYDGVLDVGMDTTSTITDLADGQPYYFALVAYDADGAESQLSQEVAHNGPPRESQADAEEPAESEIQHDEVDSDEVELLEADDDPVLDDEDEPEADASEVDPSLEQDSAVESQAERQETGAGLEVIPQSRLRIVSVDSETLRGSGAADAALDGQKETFWQTETGAKAPIHPHELVISLDEDYMVGGFRYLPRQDGKTDGMVARYSFYVSEDGVEWGEAVTTGTFTRDSAEQQVTFPAKMGCFVRFVAHSEVNGKPWTSVAEIKVLGLR